MKKRIIILGGVVFTVFALWTGAWFFLSGLVRQNVEAMALADGVSEPRIVCGGLSVGGFPFRFDVDCQDAAIGSGDLTVELAELRASVRVYAPTHLLAWARGPLKLTDSFTGSSSTVAWTTLEASVRLDNWRIARASVSGKDVVWSDNLFNAEIARAPLAEVHVFDIPDQLNTETKTAALAVYARAQSVAWPGFTLSDANAEVELELSGLPDDVRNWGDPQLLQRMQQANGALRVVAVRATDASAELNASGDLTLDEQGMVNGKLDITSTGVAERIGPMIEEPWRTLVLGTPGVDGGYTNQINFRGGVVSSGIVPIAQLLPLF